MKVRVRLPLDAHHPSPPSAGAPSASPSVSPASRLPSGLSAVSPTGGRRHPLPPPPPAPSSASSRAPPASPHPPKWPGGSQLTRRWASSPLPRRDQWAPAAGKPRPPPGGGGPSGRPAGGREGPASGGRGGPGGPRPALS